MGVKIWLLCHPPRQNVVDLSPAPSPARGFFVDMLSVFDLAYAPSQATVDSRLGATPTFATFDPRLCGYCRTIVSKNPTYVDLEHPSC